MLTRIKTRLGQLWCYYLHDGAMNISYSHYECPRCHRLITHDWGEKWTYTGPRGGA